MSQELAEAVDVIPYDESKDSSPEPEGRKGRAEIKLAVAAFLPVLGAAGILGGVFLGLSPRIYAALAGAAGIGIVFVASRVRNTFAMNALIVFSIFGIGLLLLAIASPGRLFAVRELVAEANSLGNVTRPPALFVDGWRLILGWVMGVIGFAAGWLVIRLGRRAVGLLVPVIFAGLVAFSVPKNAQVISGIVLLVLFLIAMRLVSLTEVDAEGKGVSTTRSLVRTAPPMLVLTVALILLARLGVLFPPSRINPELEPQKPKTVPLSEVEDRVLFEVTSKVTGPWRIGGLDAYDGEDWRLPAFASSQLKQVPKSGIVDPELKPEIEATFKTAGLEGPVLPGLPNTAGVRARGPELAYDKRNGNIRFLQGQASPGLTYTVFAQQLPSVDDLRRDFPIPPEFQEFIEIPEAPPAVRDLIATAPKTSKWDEFDFLRTWILDNVTVAGPGAPKSVTPERVADMIAGSKQGSPFEVVAAQAMLARWIRLPSRIGYGFDGGEPIEEGKLAVRPRHGATFVEVYFPGFKWLPVIGVPRKALSSSSEGEQQQNANVIPSDDIAIALKVPVLTEAPSVFGKQVIRIVLIVGPALLLAIAMYVLYPAWTKAKRRQRRREEAFAEGPRARIALAYREWRDACADLAQGNNTDTPLMFLDRFAPDDEHTELAWLVTRTLWGDLKEEVSEELTVSAEELSRTLRRRLAAAQPATLRAIALVSRNSMREPYGEDRHRISQGKESDHGKVAA